VKKDNFNKLPKALMLEIIKSNTLNIKEIDLFEAVVAWGKNDAKNQKLDGDKVEDLKKVLADVLPHVRFPCMTTQDIAVKVSTSGLLDNDQILDLFTYLGMKGNSKKATPGKSLKAFNATDRKGRHPPSWFKFDTTKKHNNLQLSSDGMTVTSNTTSYYQPIFGDVECSEGVWEYEIQLQQFYTASYSVCVGYIPATYQQANWSNSQMIGYSGHIPGWSFAAGNGQKFHNNDQSAYGRVCATGDVISCKIDLDKKTMEFSINGNSLGVAFTDVTGPVRPAISLYGQNTCVLRFPK